MRFSLVMVLGCAIASRSAWAQCPDGSPPPCSRAAARVPAPNSVAVLYFDNLSRDTADAYLADGLTEEIIIRLGQVQRLEVKSRFEVQRFRGRATAIDPPALGRSLNAAYLVSGSVQRAGDQVRLRVALVRAATRVQVWADVFDRTNSNLLTVESDIARAVAMAITGQLLPTERSRLARAVTRDPLAYEEYLRGLEAANREFDAASLRGALGHLDRAIERDSAFAAAHATKASVWASLADAFVAPLEAYGHAKDEALKSIALDSSQALAYAMLAYATLALQLDAREAEPLARRAVTLDPHNGGAHSTLSAVLFASDRIEESVAESRLSWMTDSLVSNYAIWYMVTLLAAKQLDSAAALLSRLRAFMPPEDADPLEGRLWAARGDLRRAAPFVGWRYYGGDVAGIHEHALLARGDTIAARATVDSMLMARTLGYYNPMALARAYSVLGDIDRGMEWLQRAFNERTVWVMLYARTDDELAPLRADPRYAALERQMRF